VKGKANTWQHIGELHEKDLRLAGVQKVSYGAWIATVLQRWFL